MLKIFETAGLEEIYIREFQDFSFLSLKCYFLFLRSEEGWFKCKSPKKLYSSIKPDSSKGEERKL